MAESAFQTMYRQEFINTFEARQSLLRDTTTTETMITGRSAVFLVAGSGGATAVTRGLNGKIPGRADDMTQYTATLQEWHDKPVKTGFNIFASQGNQRELMQKTSMAVINRKIDEDIITALSAGTQYAGLSAVVFTPSLASRVKAILGNGDVPYDGRIWGLLTPAAESYLEEHPEFASADYVTRKPMDSGEPAWKDQPGFYEWRGIKWLVHANLTGSGTSAEELYVYHQDAIGHAVDVNGIQTPVGYNEEDDYSFARCTVFMGSKLLQNTGVVRIRHDGSGFGATE